MEKYIFLSIADTLILGEGKTWDDKVDEKSMEQLNLIVKETGASVIILDPPHKRGYDYILSYLSNRRFEHTDKVIGQLIHEEDIKISSRYTEDNGYSVEKIPFKLVLGSRVNHWIDNFIARPYNLRPERRIEFEVWEDNAELKDLDFRGMRVLEEGKDYKYVILTGRTDMLLEQADRMVTVNPTFGIHQATTTETILKL